jgi:hypothetical protein
MKNKSGPEATKALESILSTKVNGKYRSPSKLQTDKGTEYLNKNFQSLMKKQKIKFFVTENDDIKAAVCERFNRTLKNMIYRHFTATGKNKYLAALPKIVHNYNSSFHRSIGMQPKNVNSKNEAEVRTKLYPPRSLPKKDIVLRAGTVVRINKTKGVFEPGYLPNWSERTYTIVEVKKTRPPTYMLNDETGERVKGAFYRNEIQPVGELLTTHVIEKILKERVRNGRREVFIKWKGFPSSQNTWEPKQNIVYEGQA